MTDFKHMKYFFAGKFSQVEGYNGYHSKSEIPNVLPRCLAL